MLIITHAIVLSITHRSDTSSWVHLYTESHGCIGCLVYGNRMRSLFMPLALLEVSMDIVPSGKPPHLRNASVWHTPTRIPMEPMRQCIALFISEMLLLTLRHPLQDTDLFAWLVNQVIALDSDGNIVNLHICFLQTYTRWLGIGIDPVTDTRLLSLPTNRSERQILLKQLCSYYQEHIDDFTLPKSLDVLMVVCDC